MYDEIVGCPARNKLPDNISVEDAKRGYSSCPMYNKPYPWSNTPADRRSVENKKYKEEREDEA